MQTILTGDPLVAAALIRRGEIVAFPTETVYGLGADAFNAAAIRAVFRAKERPSDNPLIVHVAEVGQVGELGYAGPVAKALMAAFFPGPLTLVLPRRAILPAEVTAGLDTVGVRMPSHPVAHAFLTACRTPVAAPSANRSGRPSPTTYDAVLADLDGRIPCILRGDRSDVGLESTVVDVTTEEPVVLRTGAVSLEALQTVAPSTRLAALDDAVRRSPGTRHRHYAPQASVVLAAANRAFPDQTHAFIGLHRPPQPDAFGMVLLCPNVAAYAHHLFAFFRACDAEGIRHIFCEPVPEQGLGRALMDRIRRAAQR